MKKYVFNKSIYLGFLKKNFKAGDVIELSENHAVFKGERLNDLRDINICVKKQYLVPYTATKAKEIVIPEEITEKDNTVAFGFKINKEEDVGKVIELSRYKAVVIDETKVFAEENGRIVEATGIHVSPAVTQTEITKNSEVIEENFEEIAKEFQDSEQEILEEKTEKIVNTDNKEKTKVKLSSSKTEKKQPAKTSKKPSKSSKIDSNINIESEKKEGSIRGMNIIKSE